MLPQTTPRFDDVCELHLILGLIFLDYHRTLDLNLNMRSVQTFRCQKCLVLLLQVGLYLEWKDLCHVGVNSKGHQHLEFVVIEIFEILRLLTSSNRSLIPWSYGVLVFEVLRHYDGVLFLWRSSLIQVTIEFFLSSSGVLGGLYGRGYGSPARN